MRTARWLVALCLGVGVGAVPRAAWAVACTESALRAAVTAGGVVDLACPPGSKIALSSAIVFPPVATSLVGHHNVELAVGAPGFPLFRFPEAVATYRIEGMNLIGGLPWEVKNGPTLFIDATYFSGIGSKPGGSVLRAEKATVHILGSSLISLSDQPAIFVSQGTATATSSTLGGGFFGEKGSTLTIESCTIDGDVRANGAADMIAVGNSIVLGTTGDLVDASEGVGQIASNDGNLFGAAEGTTITLMPLDQVGVLPVLGKLTRPAAGRPFARSLQPCSPGINAGPLGPDGGGVDQNGQPRFRQGARDPGAVESDQVPCLKTTVTPLDAPEGSVVTVSMTLSGLATTTGKARFTTILNGSVSATDLVVQTNEELVFPPRTTSASRLVQVLQDTVYDPGEFFSVSIGTVSGGLLASAGGSTVRIIDDDTPPVVGFGAPTLGIDVPAGGNATAQLPLTLTGATEATMDVSVSTTPGSAALAVDYAAPNGSYAFAPGGSTSQTVAVPVFGAGSVGSERSFTVQIDTATNASLGQKTALVTIRVVAPTGGGGSGAGGTTAGSAGAGGNGGEAGSGGLGGFGGEGGGGSVGVAGDGGGANAAGSANASAGGPIGGASGAATGTAGVGAAGQPTTAGASGSGGLGGGGRGGVQLGQGGTTNGAAATTGVGVGAAVPDDDGGCVVAAPRNGTRPRDRSTLALLLAMCLLLTRRARRGESS